MLLPIIATGALSGTLLVILLAWTQYEPKLRLWPSPTHYSWQSLLFWALFRMLNIATFAVAFLDWRQWNGISLERLLALAVGSTGGVVYCLAIYELGRDNLYCGQDGLVTHGIYRWSRNPQYAVAIPAILGLAVASHSGAALVLSLLLAAVFTLMAYAEEPWLEAAYGDKYRSYRQRVARFWNWRAAISLFAHLERRYFR
jgi:protein-S-isoprenylcysteine O-methyltransferase Ste14